MGNRFDIGLEGRLLYPAAAETGVGREAAWTASGKTDFDVHLGRNELTVCLSGCVAPESFLSGLAKLLQAADGHQRLAIDLTETTLLDHLGLSALIVSLRNHCGGYTRMGIQGLEAWAKERLADTGAENLFGKGWRMLSHGRQVVFERHGLMHPARHPAAAGRKPRPRQTD